MYEIESRNILTPQNGLNIYRGRTEDSILLTEIPGADSMDIGIKVDAPGLLAGVLKTRRNKGIILMGNLGDPYNIHEEKYMITRNSLKIIENYDYGVIINTRQKRILRDMDVLKGISRKTKCVVEIGFPSIDDSKLERLDGKETLDVNGRLELIKTLADEGIDVIATLTPLIPFVNDDEGELVKLIQMISDCGAKGFDLMDMRMAVKKSAREFFYTEFKKRFPDEYKCFSDKYEESGELIAEGGKKLLEEMSGYCESLGLMCDTRKLKAWKRQYENKTVGVQMSLFD